MQASLPHLKDVHNAPLLHPPPTKHASIASHITHLPLILHPNTITHHTPHTGLRSSIKFTVNPTLKMGTKPECSPLVEDLKQ